MIENMKKYLSVSAKKNIRAGVDAFKISLVILFSRKLWLSKLYYLFLSRSFDQEFFAVLKGRGEYYRSLTKLKKSSPLLRRNIHRLEKGLIMQPRRSVFAEGFISETVDCYLKAKAKSGFSQDELKWAKDVLDAYFSVVNDTSIIIRARRKYEEKKSPDHSVDGDSSVLFAPYKLSDCPSDIVDFSQFSTLLLKRRSVRWYEKREVRLDLIQKITSSASLAPSACNRQPYRFIVTTDTEHAAAIANCAGGTGGFAEQIPSIIVVVGDLSAYPKEQDRHLIYIDASLASMQLMLAATTLDLSTCPINWPDCAVSERNLRRIISIKDYERVIMLIAVGYGQPSGGIPYSQKKDTALISSGVTER